MPPQTYEEVLDYLYQRLPMFQRIGAAAIKKDLSNTIKLCAGLGNPQKGFRSIHVAGTNGKGSTSHMLASVLQSSGYRTGLYTSPHLRNFTERIKVDGEEMGRQDVVNFVNEHRELIEQVSPSFFELTVAMAFHFFLQKEVDIAVIEVGLGGRLDSTNIISPELSIITNISLDHTDMLGDTLELIAAEKAGIIKENTPVIISNHQPEVSAVFERIAKERNADLVFADRRIRLERVVSGETLTVNATSEKSDLRHLEFDLNASYQLSNMPGVLVAWEQLVLLGYQIPEEALREGLSNAKAATGLKGRWQRLNQQPLAYCDTGHNEDGIRHVVAQINSCSFSKLHMVLGMVSDKDISKVLALLPKDAEYYFCQAKIPRALAAENLATQAKKFDLHGQIVADVNEAYLAALSAAKEDDFVFVGGSSFVVAELENL